MRLPQIVISVAFATALRAADLEALRKISEHYLAKTPAPALPLGISFDEALRNQAEYVKFLTPKLGPVVAYKIGFVTAAGQQRYGINHPTRGVLLRDMLLPNNSKVPVNYGTRPVLEPDLVVRVKDEAINDATTTQEATKHLSHVIAFIELADATFATNAPVDAGVVTSANVGARLGVLGEERPFESTPEFLEGFGKMALVLRDGTGKELSRVSAEGMMGHPMNPLLWFLQDRKKRGEKLRSGDIISLGSPSPQVAPPAPGVYTLIYEGLPGGPLTASVTIQ
jgi:2-keto-4-pentenoate hydratase